MRQLTANEIEVKVKQVTSKGVVALLYKTARVDMAILDEKFGAMNWQCKYEEIKGNLYCSIGVFDEKKQQWIWKQDCGIESRADGEGNEKKGEASDSFKRAGFKWGIGTELYTSPFIFINCETEVKEVNGKKIYKQANPFEKYSVKDIWYDGNEIGAIVIVNSKKEVVFSWKKQGFTVER